MWRLWGVLVVGVDVGWEEGVGVDGSEFWCGRSDIGWGWCGVWCVC